MNNFKAKVLDLAVSQINEHTDITVTYNQVKTGRNITGFTFTFKQKAKATTTHHKQRDDTTVDMFTTLTDKQLERIARNKQFERDYNHMISPQSNANNDINEWVKVMVTKMKTSPNDFNKRAISEYLN